MIRSLSNRIGFDRLYLFLQGVASTSVSCSSFKCVGIRTEGSVLTSAVENQPLTLKRGSGETKYDV
jgi:hypothetical protein